MPLGRSSHYCQVLPMGVPNMLLCSLRGGFWKPLEKWKAVPPCPALQDIYQVGFGDSPMSLFGQLSLTGVTGYPSAIKSFCGSRVEATACPWPVLWVGTLAPSPNTVRWRCSHNISRRWALRFAPAAVLPFAARCVQSAAVGLDVCGSWFLLSNGVRTDFTKESRKMRCS